MNRSVVRKLLILGAGFALFYMIPLFVIMDVGPKIFEMEVNDGPDVGLFTKTKLMSDASVSGIAVGDFDQDGDDDVYASSYPDMQNKGCGLLLLNDNGTLTDVTKKVGLPCLTSSSAAFADITGDGIPELFVSGIKWNGQGQNRHPAIRVHVYSYVALQHTFKDITTRIGFGPLVQSSEATFSFADLDNDEDLDLAVSYLGELKRYTVENKTPFSLGRAIMSGGPSSYGSCNEAGIRKNLETYPELVPAFTRDFGDLDQLFKKHACVSFSETSLGTPGISRSLLLRPYFPTLSVNVTIPGEMRVYENMRGVFVDHSDKVTYARRTGIAGIYTNAYTVAGMRDYDYISNMFFQSVAIDVNGDSLPDIFQASDGGRNLLFINKGDFNFVDEGGQLGFSVKGTGMGVTLLDMYATGEVSFFVTNFGQVYNFIHDNDHLFILNQKLSLSHLGYGWGIGTLDVQNDGWSDIYISNGQRRYMQEFGSYNYRNQDTNYASAYDYTSVMRNRLYVNTHGSFSDRSGVDIPDIVASTRPIAITDLDEDGYDDVLVGGTGDEQTGRGLFVLKNKGGTASFVQISLSGTRSNKNGVGSKVCVKKTDEHAECKFITSGEGFSGQFSLTKTFGLGGYQGRDVDVTVYWPSGIVQSASVLKNAHAIITETE